MTSDLLSLTELHAGYGRAQVLSGISLRLPANSVVTVIGPNGAGKSTMVNAIMGVIPSKGAVTLDGVDVSEWPVEDRVKRGLILVPEKRELFGSMSVEDNLMLGGFAPMQLRIPRWRDEIEKVYALFPRLHERRTQPAGTLSGGERQMLALGRSLMSRPKVLMLDEPSLGLAPRVVTEIFGAIKQLRAEGVSILLIEQNARAALDIADYGYVLESGEVVLQGSAETLAGDARVVDTYLGGGVDGKYLD